MKNLKIIYEDKEILVCEKPANLPVQSKSLRTMDMESMIRSYLCEENRQKEPFLGIIHRLDQPVQGLLVFGKTRKATAELNKQMQNGGIKKYYFAVVCGTPGEKQGVFVDYLWKDAKNNCSCIVDKGKKDAKRAELSYRVIKEGGEHSLLEVELKTGRHHQIRVQMAGHNLPLYGDRKYHPQMTECLKEDVIGLCACRLEFLHPVNLKKMKFSCEPLGAAFEEFQDMK